MPEALLVLPTEKAGYEQNVEMEETKSRRHV